MDDAEWISKRNETLASWPKAERNLHQAIVDWIAASVIMDGIDGPEVLKVLNLVMGAVKRSMRAEETAATCALCGGARHCDTQCRG